MKRLMIITTACLLGSCYPIIANAHMQGCSPTSPTLASGEGITPLSAKLPCYQHDMVAHFLTKSGQPGKLFVMSSCDMGVTQIQSATQPLLSNSAPLTAVTPLHPGTVVCFDDLSTEPAPSAPKYKIDRLLEGNLIVLFIGIGIGVITLGVILKCLNTAQQRKQQ